MLAVKENRCYTINDTDKASFVNAGYDICDDEGNVIEYGEGKTIAFKKYMEDLKAKDAEIAKLMEDLNAKDEEIAKLKEEPKKAKKG